MIINTEYKDSALSFWWLHILEHLLHLLHLLHLQKIHWVAAWHHSHVGELLSWDLLWGLTSGLGLLFHILSDVFWDDFKSLHQLDDGEFHISEDLDQVWVGLDGLFSDVFHEIFFFVTVLFKDPIVQDKGQKHWDELDGLLSLFHVGEDFFKIVTSLVNHFSLECNNLFSNVEWDIS